MRLGEGVALLLKLSGYLNELGKDVSAAWFRKCADELQKGLNRKQLLEVCRDILHSLDNGQAGSRTFISPILTGLRILSEATHILRPSGLFDDLQETACRPGRSSLFDGSFPSVKSPGHGQRYGELVRCDQER
jgi:hypothetical protein